MRNYIPHKFRATVIHLIKDIQRFHPKRDYVHSLSTTSFEDPTSPGSPCSACSEEEIRLPLNK